MMMISRPGKSGSSPHVTTRVFPPMGLTQCFFSINTKTSSSPFLAHMTISPHDAHAYCRAVGRSGAPIGLAFTPAAIVAIHITRGVAENRHRRATSNNVLRSEFPDHYARASVMGCYLRDS